MFFIVKRIAPEDSIQELGLTHHTDIHFLSGDFSPDRAKNHQTKKKEYHAAAG